ncbi:hypothetical protein QR680_016689 [Steinernema hermaphroditum]|uniref:Uncharacterized protein n=1 Tax=Steinernema hermaphroditum TaxID=289476 RepID=A0AA39HBZ2_9BILA|nr:hypothetical protein QR680_016689 [Steinernema hermaphroditum]
MEGIEEEEVDTEDPKPLPDVVLTATERKEEEGAPLSVADRSHHDPRRQHPPEASESEFLDAASAAHGYELRFHRRRHLHQKQRLG